MTALAHEKQNPVGQDRAEVNHEQSKYITIAAHR
jgi:hypothetical protein